MIRSRVVLSEGKWLEAIMLAISQLWVKINWGGISPENVCIEEAVQLQEDRKYLGVGEVHGSFLEISHCSYIMLHSHRSSCHPHCDTALSHTTQMALSGPVRSSSNISKYQGLCAHWGFFWRPRWEERVLADDQSLKQLEVHLGETINEVLSICCLILWLTVKPQFNFFNEQISSDFPLYSGSKMEKYKLRTNRPSERVYSIGSNLSTKGKDSPDWQNLLKRQEDLRKFSAGCYSCIIQHFPA